MTTKQNQKYTFTYQQSDSNRQAIIDNKPSEFKSTPDHATERSMMEVAKSGPFACPCPLMYAEKCDEAMWFRARAEYLTQKKYEDDKTIRKLNIKIAEIKTAVVEFERTGRKPDELWTDEETEAFRVKITKHNEEAERRHQERQKAAAEAKLDDTLIGLIAVRQQNEFEKGEHDKPWCAEAEEQFRELLMCMPFEGKQKLQLKYNAEN